MHHVRFSRERVIGCPMCVHIAREAMLMSLQDLSVDRIREEIRVDSDGNLDVLR